MRICIISDAWHPQVNGVVRTLDTLRRHLKGMGHRVYMITPHFFPSIPCPSYGEVRLCFDRHRRTTRLLNRIRADAIHIATEGPLGWAARRWCLKNNMPFTTAYHTAFPEYIAARLPVTADAIYPILRRFHAPSAGVYVATKTVRNQLAAKGFKNIVNWTRGVDTAEFSAGRKKADWDFARPIQLYVGRVTVEKNIEAFLKADTEGTKVVVGDGPALSRLKATYPHAKFLGAKFGRDLAQAYASADVFVFPSVTDTFGLVLIEALACGTPVAAYPVQGPLDVLGADGCGPFEGWTTQIAALDENIETAIGKALRLKRNDCRQFARHYDWATVGRQFINSLALREDDRVANQANLGPTAPVEAISAG